jgi:S-disulfanyl-L-cysteine oxidoreductase SoxD
MHFSNFLAAVMLLVASVPALAQTPSFLNVGRAATKAEIRAWDIAVAPDGKGLPPGQGTAKEGATIFEAKCAVCHGPAAEGGKIGPSLLGSKSDIETFTTLRPVRSIGGYWAFATTVWDYINRAMPRNQGGSLRPDEVYALTAFILSKNGIIRESDVLDAKTLPKIQMPNRNGFVPQRFEDIPDERKRGCRQGICP